MFNGLRGGLKDVGLVFLANVQFMYNSLVELFEDGALATDVVDLVSQFVVCRQGLVEFLRHLKHNKTRPAGIEG